MPARDHPDCAIVGVLDQSSGSGNRSKPPWSADGVGSDEMMQGDPVGKLDTGDQAPAFTLPDQDGKPVALADFAGQQVVVYFYPRDDTPGCTKEACQFNENLSAFKRAKVPVLGISADTAAKHQKFREKYGLKFPLLTDADHEVGEAFGAWGEKTMYGKKVIGVIRSTFLVAADGTIARAWYHVKADGHAAKVLEELKG